MLLNIVNRGMIYQKAVLLGNERSNGHLSNTQQNVFVSTQNPNFVSIISIQKAFSIFISFQIIDF